MFRVGLLSMSLLLAPTCVEAQTYEPLNKINSFVLNTDYSQDQEADANIFIISGNASFLVDLCATNQNMNRNATALATVTFRVGSPDFSFTAIIAPQSTNCIRFGGDSGQIIELQFSSDWVETDWQETVLYTTQTTPSGTVTLEQCKLGSKGPFDCQPLP
jgi:hypothetical protein